VTAEVARLLGALEGEMRRGELMAALGLSDPKHFQSRYQQPAIAAGFIEMNLPDKPRSRAQRYRLTELGRRARQAGGRAS